MIMIKYLVSTKGHDALMKDFLEKASANNIKFNHKNYIIKSIK